MKLSVIIPVYNEKNTILKILKKVRNVPVDKEIIIVDDGSTDGTREILKSPLAPLFQSGEKQTVAVRFIARRGRPMCLPERKEIAALKKTFLAMTNKNEIKVILKQKNEGKGSAIRTGLKKVTGDVVIIQDADLEYDPDDYLKLLEAMRKTNAGVVYGSRVLSKSEKSSFAFYFGGRLLSILTNILYKTRITDEPTCYKMFKTNIIKSLSLECKGFEFCPEVTAKLCKAGHKIVEIPIQYYPRKIKDGKKIRWSDGLTAIYTLIKYKFHN